MEEKNSIFKNIWVLSGMLLGISMLICYVGVLIIGKSIYYSAGIVSAVIVGNIYTSKIKEIMPKGSRIKVVSIYAVIQIIIVLMYIALFRKNFHPQVLYAELLVSVIFMIVQAPLMNSTLRFIGAMYLKGYSKTKP